jgi:hypothetical protein
MGAACSGHGVAPRAGCSPPETAAARAASFTSSDDAPRSTVRPNASTPLQALRRKFQGSPPHLRDAARCSARWRNARAGSRTSGIFGADISRGTQAIVGTCRHRRLAALPRAEERRNHKRGAFAGGVAGRRTPESVGDAIRRWIRVSGPGCRSPGLFSPRRRPRDDRLPRAGDGPPPLAVLVCDRV